MSAFFSSPRILTGDAEQIIGGAVMALTGGGVKPSNGAGLGGQVLTSGGPGVDPSWQSLKYLNDVHNGNTGYLDIGGTRIVYSQDYLCNHNGTCNFIVPFGNTNPVVIPTLLGNSGAVASVLSQNKTTFQVGVYKDGVAVTGTQHHISFFAIGALPAK